MNYNLFERLILPVVIVLGLSLGGVMSFATSLMHSPTTPTGTTGAPPQ